MRHAGRMGLIDPFRITRNDPTSVNRICEYFQNNKEEYSVDHMRRALIYAGIEVKPANLHIARDIYRRKWHKDVSSNYDF